MLGVYTIVKPAAELGWGSGRTLGLGAASFALLVLSSCARRGAAPSYRSGSSARATSRGPTPSRPYGRRDVRDVLSRVAVHAAVLGYDALEIGLAFLPATIVMGPCRSATRSG